MKPFHQADLDNFVAEVDAAGGPGAPDFWQRWGELRYVPTRPPPPELDPYGEPYFAAMLEIYEEVSGRKLDPAVTEITNFDFGAHAGALTAYGPAIAPAGASLHYQRLASAVRLAGFAQGAAVLDMGAGWGMSTEFLALCGLIVTAVDINPDFVRLIEHRCRAREYPVRVVRASFDEFQPDQLYDGVLFYECLHHAAKPWALIGKMAAALRPGGCIVLAGEPIQDEYWPHWGIRRDPLSIYCVRKFGWFESGWSLEFLRGMFERAGLTVEVKTDHDPEIGIAVCAREPAA